MFERKPEIVIVKDFHASPTLLTVSEVAGILRTTAKAVYTMVGRGQLPGLVRIGRRVLIRKQALLNWLDHNCASSSEGRR